MTRKQFEELGEQWMPLKNVPIEGVFRLKANDSAPVWVRGDYERTTKKYLCSKWEDCNHETAMKGERLVWVGFIF